ncbi:hypothetical protein DFH27DRAFT_610272 [Peziza echinospora]|nr:hypothetical protein DFH27DRAFT_610272 [Peziza echinospora]
MSPVKATTNRPKDEQDSSQSTTKPRVTVGCWKSAGYFSSFGRHSPRDCGSDESNQVVWKHPYGTAPTDLHDKDPTSTGILGAVAFYFDHNGPRKFSKRPPATHYTLVYIHPSQRFTDILPSSYSTSLSSFVVTLRHPHSTGLLLALHSNDSLSPPPEYPIHPIYNLQNASFNHHPTTKAFSSKITNSRLARCSKRNFPKR